MKAKTSYFTYDHVFAWRTIALIIHITVIIFAKNSQITELLEKFSALTTNNHFTPSQGARALSAKVDTVWRSGNALTL